MDNRINNSTNIKIVPIFKMLGVFLCIYLIDGQFRDGHDLECSWLEVNWGFCIIWKPKVLFYRVLADDF